jgi:NAD(P)-dependent dehydrogenase (short-subunit alcohol dehydrogenase family)
VIATGRREEALATLVREAAGFRGKLDVLRLDVTSANDVAAAKVEVDRLTDGYGLDVLVNNAGFGQMGPVETVSDEAVRRQYETTCSGSSG